MRYIYSVAVGTYDFVFFASKRSALNYAARHSISRSNVRRTLGYLASDIREDYHKLKIRIDKQNNGTIH
jgi:hypothetical protein